LPNADRTLHFRIILANLYIYQSVLVKANHDVDEMIRQTEATKYCKRSFLWPSLKGFHQVNKERLRFKPIFFAFVKSDERSKKAIENTAVRAEASLFVHGKLFHDNVQPTLKYRRQQLRTDVKKTNTTPAPPFSAKEQAAHAAILHKRHHQHHWLTGLEQQSEGQEQDREVSESHP
jgi:hypothetical protein